MDGRTFHVDGRTSNVDGRTSPELPGLMLPWIGRAAHRGPCAVGSARSIDISVFCITINRCSVGKGPHLLRPPVHRSNRTHVRSSRPLDSQ